MQESAITQIKSKCTIAWAWAELGLTGSPAKECRSPFREDKSASFSVYRDASGWEKWKDHGSGEGGDIIDLWMKARGLDKSGAIREIQRVAGGGYTAPRYVMPEGKVPTPKATVKWPEMRPPTQKECRALGELRGLLPGAFDIAGKLGTLKVSEDVFGFKSWIITDTTRRCAEARRFDGIKFPAIGSLKERKGHCLKGSQKNWPMGLVTDRSEFNAIDNLLLVEGMPDYFAALSLAIDAPISFRPICTLGAGITHFSDEARPYLKGKIILIISHNDVGGQNAVPQWVNELYRLGAKRVVGQRLPFEHDDLNDFLKNPESINPLDLLKGFANAPDRNP